MSRHRLIKRMLWCAAAGVVLCTLPNAASARPRSAPNYGGQLDFGQQLLYLDDGCLTVHGSLTSGDFFDDLKRIDNGGQLAYKRRGKTVTEYPESLTTSIRLIGDTCAAALSNSPSSIFRGDSYSLKLEVNWKRDMQMRPAALSPLLAHCVGYSSIALPDKELTIPSIVCEMKVDSKGVPLSDHLIVSIFGADGRQITRISAAP